jgi:hypothetical protein
VTPRALGFKKNGEDYPEFWKISALWVKKAAFCSGAFMGAIITHAMH